MVEFAKQCQAERDALREALSDILDSVLFGVAPSKAVLDHACAMLGEAT